MISQVNQSGLNVRNYDSKILQLFELSYPYMILLESYTEATKEVVIQIFTMDGYSEKRFLTTEYLFSGKRPLHKHDFIEIMYVISGCVTNHIENLKFTYGPGQCCVMNKNICHCEEFSGNFQAAFFMLKDEFLMQIFQGMLSETEAVSLSGHKYAGKEPERAVGAVGHNPVYSLISDSLQKSLQYASIYLDCLPVVPAEKISAQMDPMIQMIFTELKERRPGAGFFIKGGFARLIYLLGDPALYCIDRVQSDSDSQEFLFTKIVHLMEASHGRCSREMLSASLHYNAEYLNRIVKKYTGKTLLDYGQAIYLEEARRLLMETDQSVSEIITSLGFSNRTYFYRLFKNMFGKTPGDYRGEKVKKQR